MQDHHANGRDLIVTHLLDAIRQVREDVAKVELWADALSGFSQPVPDYNLEGASVWYPAEQATALKRPREARASFDKVSQTGRMKTTAQ
jgi:hypothetical protein